jgi:hypothetical protein
MTFTIGNLVAEADRIAARAKRRIRRCRDQLAQRESLSLGAGKRNRDQQMSAAEQRLASMLRISAGHDKAKITATAPATPAQTSEVGKSVPFCQPKMTLVAPDAPMKTAAEK